MAKKLSAVRRTKRTAKNASYFLTHGKDSLPCVLISGGMFAVRFNFGRTAKIFFLPPLFP
jgi:hypothetical protein